MNALLPAAGVPPELPADLALPPASPMHGAGSASAVVPAGGFGKLFSEGLARVEATLAASQADMQRLAQGDAQNLHQVMVRLEESRIAFQLMVQVRSRLLEAYQDLMRMQI